MSGLCCRQVIRLGRYWCWRLAVLSGSIWRCPLYFCIFWSCRERYYVFFFFFQAEDGIRDRDLTGVQTCALPIWLTPIMRPGSSSCDHYSCGQKLSSRSCTTVHGHSWGKVGRGNPVSSLAWARAVG